MSTPSNPTDSIETAVPPQLVPTTTIPLALPPKIQSRMMRTFGFDSSSLHNWSSFVRLMNRPEDPVSLALFRILFGILMLIDIPNERGMADADIEYGDKFQCSFPLFSFVKPLSMQFMVILYALMFLGALGITIGFRYRISCFIFVSIYWYMFFLDKTTWNNHSYLYGLFGFLLLLTDGNRYFNIQLFCYFLEPYTINSQKFFLEFSKVPLNRRPRQ